MSFFDIKRRKIEAKVLKVLVLEEMIMYNSCSYSKNSLDDLQNGTSLITIQ